MNKFPEQTHFIGFPLPSELEEKITYLRRYVNTRYGCKSGHSTLPHITLIPPFKLSEEYTTNDILKRLENIKFTPFISSVDGFG
ncbi:MAG: 2'-5' RNA ligase family protein, partial [Sphaerochaetaceae bacterium]|nr:2'-5' RNA ligase family protein [Sphaerochaetaceae bacterium]